MKKLLKSDLYSKNIINISISNNTVFYTLELSETFFKYLGKKYPTRRLQKTKKFYINSNNWAIEEAEHKWTAKLPLTDSIVFQKVQIIMQEYQKNYFLKLIDFSGSITDEYFKIGLDVNYNHKATLMVNNIILDKKSTERIRLRNALKTDLPLWNVKYNYNPDFWNNYNILLDKPIDISVKKDLEKVDPLEKQFNDGGLKNSIKH